MSPNAVWTMTLEPAGAGVLEGVGSSCLEGRGCGVGFGCCAVVVF